MNYTVKNEYGISGESNHKTIEAALRARDKRAGRGWIVEDSEGNRYDWIEVGHSWYMV